MVQAKDRTNTWVTENMTLIKNRQSVRGGEVIVVSAVIMTAYLSIHIFNNVEILIQTLDENLEKFDLHFMTLKFAIKDWTIL